MSSSSTSASADDAGSSLRGAVLSGNKALVSSLVAAGGDINANGPVNESCIAIAFEAGQTEMFAHLLDLGADVTRSFTQGYLTETVLGELFKAARRVNKDDNAAVPEKQVFMLHTLLDKKPGIALFRWGASFLRVTMLEEAVHLESPELVEHCLQAGATFAYEFDLNIMTSQAIMPTLASALYIPHLGVLRVLLKWGILDDWSTRYVGEGRRQVISAFSRISAGGYKGCLERAREGKPLCLVGNDAVLRLLQEAGLNDGFSERDEDGARVNLLILELFPEGCPAPLLDDETVELLRRYKAAGFDVSRVIIFSSGREGPDLLYYAAQADSPVIIDFAVQELGLHVDRIQTCLKEESSTEPMRMTALSAAIGRKKLKAADSLLDKWHAKVTHPELRGREQAVMRLLDGSSGYTDAEALPLLKRLMDLDPGLFDHPCYKQASSSTPLGACAGSGKIECLRYMLSCNLPGTKELSFREFAFSINHWPVTSAQIAALRNDWSCVEVFVEYACCGPVVERIGGQPAVLELAQAALRGAGSVTMPRALFSRLMVLAKENIRQLEADAAAEAKAEGAKASAFEDPSLRVIPAREEKKKAKKKKAKKKARAKKQAAARVPAAGAGAAGDVGESSDDSSSDEEEEGEEPDDNLVDSRNAPSLEVLMAAMGIGTGAASPPGPT